MTNFTYSNELYHHGVKGMKWGVRMQQYRNQRNKRFIQREVDFQKKKIASHEKQASLYRSNAKQVREKGISELLQKGYDKSTAEKAVKLFSDRNDTEASWHEHQAKYLKAYNKRISSINTDSMTLRQVHKMILEEGNKTLNEINGNWVEPSSTAEYHKARYGQ